MQFVKKVTERYSVEAGPVIDIRTGKTIKKGLPPSPPPQKISADPVVELMKAAQEYTGFHLGHQDDIIDIEEDIQVNAFKMSEDDYSKMETQMKKTKKSGPSYEVYAWNDGSGYDYWSKEGEDGDTNYIKVTAHIKKVKSVDPKKLAADMEDVYGALEHWGNVR